MAIRSEVFDGQLPGLAEALQRALPAIGEGSARNLAEGSEPVLTGPFAAYSADPRAFVEQRAAERAGWRGLIMQDDAPLATVDVYLAEAEPPTYGIRGRNSAGALANALSLARQFEDGDERYTVRWLTLPEIYVTAIWLDGPCPRFIPTRLGGSDRPEISVLDEEAFLEQVNSLITQAARSPVPTPEGGGPRSGLK